MNQPSPPSLQATYVPEQMAFAFWGAIDSAAELARLEFPAGTPTVCRFAVPDADGGIAVRDVDTHLIKFDSAVKGLRDLNVDLPGLGTSVRAWKEVIESGGSHVMPTAGHAATYRNDTALRSADSTVQQFNEAAAVLEELRFAGIQATLRPYQVRGVAWLKSLSSCGGGILADEMGLGKTLQAIAMMAIRAGDRPHLVVCPTSVVGNWRNEIQRFAPHLPLHVHHGSGRNLPRRLAAGSVVLTSYSVLRSDIEQLAPTTWSSVIFDEAQQIKNPTSLAAKAALRLTTDITVAMTGTPVENRLDELWSLFRVANPSLLGTRARFRQRFAAPIESGRSATAAARLATIIDPYILHRTKDAVATDLPPKQFATVMCTLTSEQARIYRSAVADAFDSGLGTGIARRGNILALLTTLKQVCNHPAQVTGDAEDLRGRSGKFDRATEMLAEIVDAGDRALVFTQYRTMGDMLSKHLGSELNVGDVPFLHGGLSTSRRDAMVDAFQTGQDSSPVLILSLRAAGFGLNLTRASHVVHYDRWWNPAVEDQATDRAHRIGQERTVNVHTLVTGGTVEDHIAAMHLSKRSVAESISGGSEAELAKLPDTELRDLLELDGAVIN
ncbi:DEAD/DEAH box helicase [Rhodococcus sp. SMB37]|uniref:DEAD/DEAH box helicase n=1 Tax=Rhodococcus sp. SMB37 TaxID=2512213 RepID=UPI001F545F7C|nr:DEAD/DEAH box helicase [Rhodococcus sp. SMB37]